jgi:hypothetical protein
MLLRRRLTLLPRPTRLLPLRYSLYLHYWYKITNYDAAAPLNAQFTCFTGTKVHIMTQQCSVYLIYWYKSTSYDAAIPLSAVQSTRARLAHRLQVKKKEKK